MMVQRLLPVNVGVMLLDVLDMRGVDPEGAGAWIVGGSGRPEEA